MAHAGISIDNFRDQYLKGLDRLPPLSPVATRLLGLLAHRDQNISELGSVIETDPLLAAQILKLANSALFGISREVVSVRHAIGLLGLAVIRKVALASCISNLFGRRRMAPTFSVTRFNLHSVATGMFTELLCEQLPIAHSSDAFIAGLLHDIGKLILAVSMPDQYESALAVAAVRRQPLIQCERSLMGADHAELSGLAVERWGLSTAIRRAARCHHSLEAAGETERVETGKISLSLAVYHANQFVNYLGRSVHPQLVIANTEPPSLDFPGFFLDKGRLLSRFQEESKSLDNLFR